MVLVIGAQNAPPAIGVVQKWTSLRGCKCPQDEFLIISKLKGKIANEGDRMMAGYEIFNLFF